MTTLAAVLLAVSGIFGLMSVFFWFYARRTEEAAILCGCILRLLDEPMKSRQVEIMAETRIELQAKGLWKT